MSENSDTTVVEPTPASEQQFDPSVLPPPPFQRPPRPRPTLPQSTLAQLGALLLAAIVGNIALQAEVAAVAATVAAIIVAKLVFDVIGTPRRATIGFLMAATLFAAWLPLRASTWLTSLNTVAVFFFLVSAALTARPMTLRLSTEVVGTLLSRLWLAWWFPRVLADAVKPLRSERSARLAPIARGLAIAFVPVVVLTTLLASADVVFAQSITTDLDPASLFGHLVLTVVVAAAIAGLLAVTGIPTSDGVQENRPLGATEALVLLGSIGTLYGGFALVQLVSAFGRADAILQEQGVTYAEYARSGFFQLLWVAALTLVLLGVVRLLVANGTRTLDILVRAAGAAVALLTTVIVAVAILRLGLYTEAFGQTTLRWYCTAFAWMLGAAFIAIAIGHVTRAQHLLAITLLGLVTVTLFAVNVLNPEARVAEHNLTRPDATESLDAFYLSRLSADAWPAILEHQAIMNAHLGAGSTLGYQCAKADETRGYGPLGFNLSEARLTCP